MTILSKSNSLFVHLLAATLLMQIPVAVAGPNQAPTATVLTPTNGAKFSAPATIGLTATAADSDGSVVRVEYYLGRTLLGSATTPPYLFNWTNVPAGTYVLNATAIDDRGKAGDSANITITVATVTTFITSPPANAVLPAGSISVSGTFAGPADTTVIVSGSGGNSRLATISGNAFTATNLLLAAGPNTIEAGVARRDGTTDIVTRNVTAVPPPLIVLTSPAICGPFLIPATITLTAEALSVGGSVAKVEFFDNNTLIGTATSPPYTIQSTFTQAGTRYFYARVTDAIGQVTDSPAVNPILTSIPPVVNLTSPANGATYRAGQLISLAATATDADGTIAAVDFLLDGNPNPAYTVSTSPYTTDVRLFTLGTHTIAARARDNGGTTATTALATFHIIANQLPTVTLDQPASSMTAAVGVPITLAATASDADSGIAEVAFEINGSAIIRKTSPPYTATWTPTFADVFTLVARAIDNDFGSTSSAPVTVTVVANQLPNVTLTSPPGGASFTAPSDVPLAANATDDDGSIAKVEFFAGSTLIGTVSMAPYNLVWVKPLPGTYTLTAKATDNRGATRVSAGVAITVTGTTARITAPVDGATFVAPASFTLSGIAATSAGSITKLEVFENGSLISTANLSGSPQTLSLNLSGIAAGSYVYTLKATLGTGASVTSAPVTVTVATPAVVTLSTLSNFYLAPANIDLIATAVPPGTSTIAKVEFFNGSSLIATVTAPPYSFRWSGVIAGAYTLTAKATDSAGLAGVSPPLSLTVGSAVTIAFAPGLNGSTVYDESVLISGSVQAGPNSAVTVNGQLATVTADGQFFANAVPLAVGANTIAATLTGQDGETATQSIAVTRAAPIGGGGGGGGSSTTPDFRVTVDPLEGIIIAGGSFPVNVTIEGLTGRSFATITLACDANYAGSSVTLGRAQCAYTTPGNYTVQVTVKDAMNAVIYAKANVVVVKSAMQQFLNLRAVYSGVIDRLKASNIDGAVSSFTNVIRENYRTAFTQAGSGLSAMVDGFGTVKGMRLNGDFAEMLVVRTTVDGQIVFSVFLVRDGDGIWRIDGF